MTREIRTGYDYYCDNSRPSSISGTKDCNGGSFLSVIESGGNLSSSLTKVNQGRIHYFYDSNKHALLRSLNNLSSNSFLAVTPSAVKITGFKFFVDHATDATDNKQPTVSIWLAGTLNEGNKYAVSFFLQTSVTQRLLDLG